MDGKAASCAEVILMWRGEGNSGRLKGGDRGTEREFAGGRVVHELSMEDIRYVFGIGQ